MEGQPGIGGEERWCVAQKLAETSLKGLTYAVDNLSGPTPGTLQDVTGYHREKATYFLIIKLEI